MVDDYKTDGQSTGTHEDIDVEDSSDVQQGIFCNVCKRYINQEKETWGEHTKTNHPLECGVCKLRLSSERAIENHTSEQHNEIYTETNDHSYNFIKDRD